MIRFASQILLVILLAALSGCSVFGIATKGELEAAMQQEAVHQRELEARLASLDQDIEASREEMAALDRRMADATSQWAAMQAALVSHFDSLRTEFVTLDRDLDLVSQGVTTASAQAAQAQLDSRKAMRIQYETLLDDRDRLMRQLESLDMRLEAWPAGADTSGVPDEVAGIVEPRQDIGAGDVSAITPADQPDGAGSH